MNIILSIILLIIGFVLLIKGADIFVDGASSTAENFRISKMLIGLTIVAFGTSAPEFAVSVSALASGSTDMVLGNVIGSCILNILLILGLAAVVRPIRIANNTIKMEIPLCLLISTLLVVLFLDTFLGAGDVNQVTRADAIVILLFFAVFLYYLFILTKQRKDKDEENKLKFKLGKSLVLVLVGLAGIVIGSQLVVNSASSIAETIGMSERLIALTVIAFGTSLPELVTSIVAARKGEHELVVGNIIGSNIFNICVVLGVPVAIFGTITAVGFQYLDLVMLMVSVIMLFIFSASGKRISRMEGAAMLMVFVAYYSIILVA